MASFAAIIEGLPAAGGTHLHQALAHYNRQRALPRSTRNGRDIGLQQALAMRDEALRYIEQQRRPLAPLLDRVPLAADAFMRWFEDLRIRGPGQNDALFPWLADSADMRSMRWFLQQDLASEAGLDDLVALTQTVFPAQVTRVLARNGPDERERRPDLGMRNPTLDRVVQELDLHAQIEDTVWEALALANLMSGLATNRDYAYQSIGALGVIAMAAPARISQVHTGLTRLAAPAAARAYLQLYAGLDTRHTAAWNREVIRPLVKSDPKLARAIAEGALLWLQAGARCFERYRRCLITQPVYARALRPLMAPQPARAPQIGMVAS